MAQLIQLRDRIRTIETIHKITHAMRLISMSHHARLKYKEESLQKYAHELNMLFLKVKALAAQWQHEVLYPTAITGRQLVIIVGSQKGLCGSFNTVLFKFIHDAYAKMHIKSPEVIVIGKRARDYVQDHALGTIVQEIAHISYRNIQEGVQQVSDYIMSDHKKYDRITLYAHNPKSFFMQVPQAHVLVPFLQEEGHNMAELSELMQDYMWEQPADDILPTLVQQCMHATIYNILFRSLLAEQAARFLSMDGATRNAKRLLEATTLQYNKLRQAKITREIIELSEIR